MTRDEWNGVPNESGEVNFAPGTVPLSTVVASLPGVSEQSLKATLLSLPTVTIVGIAAGCLSALHMVREKAADVVVVDANLPLADVRILLRQIREQGLPTQSLVLATTSDQVRRALAAGAHASLRRDSPTPRLGAVLADFQRARATRMQSSTDEPIPQG